MPAKNANLWNAKIAKNDEFYTQLSDIENELKHYKEHFKWKVVYCNCDDPYESNFFKYFAANFNFLWLKKLIATSYATSPIAHTKLNLLWDKRSYKIEINKVYDANWDWAEDLADVEQLLREWKWENRLTPLKWDWDFRSEECIELLKQADIVVTNPPFSLFREYITQLIKYEKDFLIVGNMNWITYKEVFPLIKNNKLWTWYKHFGGGMNMIFPKNLFDSKKVKKYTLDSDWNYIVNIMWVIWYTNLDISKRHEKLILYKKYSEEEYPQYENYNAINVDKVSDIPFDYDWVMWVPITFLDKYNPEQFELLGRDGDLDLSVTYDFFIPPSEDLCEKYKKASNTWRVQNAYLVNNGMAKTCYKRLFIRRKKS